MSFDLARPARSLAIVSLLALAAAGSAGCASAAPDAGEGTNPDGNGATTQPLTDVNHSSVKRQSIGNCWLYATASWVEALHKAGTGEELNTSESYWTYWHWFDQIANGGLWGASEIQTGGGYDVSSEIISRYGIIPEADFIPAEANAEMSGRQKSALDAINLSLKSGELSKPEVRSDRAKVRAELDKAWGLTPEMTAQLDTVFGKDVSKTLDKATASTGTSIKRAVELEIQLMDPRTQKPVKATLADALGKRSSSWGPRTGTLAWQTVSYPTTATERRNFQVRVQKAMHDSQPVILSWFVDFNALDPQGRFMAPPATPGRQGGHMVVVEDYEINDVPGFGTLKAGELETRPEALAAALDPRANISFIRVKNSWGAYRPDRQFVVPGYHDLYMKYLNGPVQQCAVDANEVPDPTKCHNTTPWQDATLPAGY